MKKDFVHTLLVRYHIFSYKPEKEDYVYVGACYVSNYEEFVKTLTFIMEKELEMSFNETETSLDLTETQRNATYTIEELNFTLPSETSAMVLDVYLK